VWTRSKEKGGELDDVVCTSGAVVDSVIRCLAKLRASVSCTAHTPPPVLFSTVPAHGPAMESASSRGQVDEAACFLDIYVHEARDVHANGDVYAKFALTSDHAPARSTRFDARLPPLRVRRARVGVDVLKCEVWMRSCTRPVLGDQLLGFALVPLAAVAAAEGARLARDFDLSSTDLLHSPAGTVRLSLALHSVRVPPGAACPSPPDEEPSITSEVVILEPTTVDYAGIEFPDLNAVEESHGMSVQYLPFLQLGEPRPPEAIMETSRSPRGDGEKTASSDGSKNASTTTTASSSPAKAVEKPLPDAHESTAPMSCRSPETPTSSSNGKENKGDVFTSPLRGIGMDAEHSEMQRQIMEMYVKSMQQFSESLPKVTMPIELAGGDGVVVQKEKPEDAVKNGGARVFYGSRAFF
jgi:hypothetical protein